MGWTILFIILLLIGLGLLGGTLMSSDKNTTAGLAFGGVVVIVIAFLGFFVAGFKSVPVKSIGVVTSFGKVEGFMGPGIHHTWPWKTVNVLPETVQTTTFENGSCLNVRIGGQQQACLDVTIQWQIKDSAADALFTKYDTSGTSVLTDVTNAVVVRELKVAVNQEMGDYNPIADVAANGQSGNSQFSTFGPAVEQDMKRDIGNDVNIQTVLIPFMHYDNSTQARLNAIQQQYGNTAIAQQQIVTNQAQARANRAIASSVSNNPGVLEQECLNIVQASEKDHYELPAGFNCNGGGSNLSLAVPAGR